MPADGTQIYKPYGSGLEKNWLNYSMGLRTRSSEILLALGEF